MQGYGFPDGFWTGFNCAEVHQLSAAGQSQTHGLAVEISRIVNCYQNVIIF